MNQTVKLGLFKPEVTDDVQDTIVRLALNMQVIDDKYNQTVADIESALNSGEVYEIGKRYWNAASYIGGFAGWVNVRTGTHAKKWVAGKTYAVGDIVRPTEDNGHFYQCVTSGTACINEPYFDTTPASATMDVRGSSRWEANHHYRIDDLVVATSGDMTFYFKCIKDGFSGATEPSWNRVEGGNTTDGTTEFMAFRTVKWVEQGVSSHFAKFGYIGEVTRKYTESIGDGTTNVITVNHRLGTLDVVVMVRKSNSPLVNVNGVTIETIDEDNVKITFTTIPTLDEYRVTVIG